jgi:hypothetical protein
MKKAASLKMYLRKLNMYFRLAMVIRETKTHLLFSSPTFALNIATSVDMIRGFCLSHYRGTIQIIGNGQFISF